MIFGRSIGLTFEKRKAALLKKAAGGFMLSWHRMKRDRAWGYIVSTVNNDNVDFVFVSKSSGRMSVTPF